ncbi:MAG TPA: adenylate/guanylate cyclase domain-containing protein [Planosporangium sp.]|jgi:predicted ATPase/class 3 adenylate cyclase|nr:adenylate/guanylate cyclase domain-containing protein [Planosporangium sp.]
MIDHLCLHCHTPADPSHRFCGRCGSPLHIRCTACSSLIAPGLEFCTVCGHPLSPALPAPDAGREERRTVTTLFLDLVGFTRMAEGLDPEDLRQLQMSYFSTASAVIRRYGGILEKYIGDAVVAVFGIPVETEHDAVRAVRAGLDLQRALDERPLAGRYPMRARVGIATGEALVDLAAVRNAGEAMVSGDVVATASRLQTHAPDGGVLVAAPTRRATVGSIRYADPPRRVSLAGKSQPMEVWLAQGTVGRVQVIDDDAVQLVGRGQELDLVTSALTRCIAERETRLLSVVGIHGIGKSRLVREVARRVESSPDVVLRWMTGRCLPYGEGGPYAALAEIVKAQAGVLDTDDEQTTRSRLTAALAEIVPAGDVDRLTELLGPLVGLPGRPVNAGEIETAWRDVLLALAQNLPTILVVEDLHFADEAMIRFLCRLMQTVSDAPLFVLCTYRPELLDDQPVWAGGPPGTLTVSLAPLRGAALRALAGQLLRRHGLPETLTDRLAAITGGNPMYLVEYVRMLAERAADGELDLEADITIPETVHGVVANRIDLLDTAERTVLNAAAVLGDTACPGAVTAMLALAPDDVNRALRGLRRRDMLVAAAGGEAELEFRHQLLCDVAYGRLPRASRATLHRRAAAWLQGQAVAGRHDLAAAVARHRVAALTLATSLGVDTAADTEATRQALVSASDAAFAVYAVGPALAHLEEALTHWPRDLEPAQRLAAELQRRRLQFLADSERFYQEDGAKELLRIAERMLDGGDRCGAARAETLLGQAEYMRADQERAAEHLGRAITFFTDLPASAAKAEAYGELARVHLMRYRPAEAAEVAGVARELAEQLGLADATASAMVTEAIAQYLDGDLAGLDQLERAAELCRAQRLPALRRAAHNLSALLLEEGDLRRAADAAAESAAAHGMQVSLVISHSAEAERAYFTGDWGTLLHAADVYFDADDETREWDLQLRARRAWIRNLCGETSDLDIERCLETARHSGLDRLLYNACAHGALYHSIRGEDTHAVTLLGELVQTWREAPTTITMEWLSAVAHVATLTPSAALLATEVVATVPRRTRWVEAADLLASGARAEAAGDYAVAGSAWAEAVERYDAIGAASDAILVAASAVRAFAAAGSDAPRARSLSARVRAFAERNRAPGLVRLAGQEP